MSAIVVTLIALGALAFGAVYPWGFLPLFAAAALVGLVGLARGGVPGDIRPLALWLLLLWAAAAAQLLPLPRRVVDALSPSTAALAGLYNLSLADPAAGWLPLSIDPARTQVAVLALAALGLYVIGLPALLNGGSIRSLPRGLAAFAVPLALFAIYTRERNNDLMYGFWQSIDGGGGDQAGPFVNRNHFGGWMVMSLCLMIGWLCGQIERFRPGGSHRRREIAAWIGSEKGGSVLLMTAAVALGTIALFWTISRSSIASFGVAATIFMLLVVRRRRLGTAQRIAVLTTLGTVLLASVAWRGLDVLVQWFLDERSLVSRLDAWRDGWQVVREFPLSGTGLNTYGAAMRMYQEGNPGFHMAQAHNDYLQLLAEGGTLVAIPAAAVTVLLARAVRRTLRAARGEARGYWVRAGAAVGLVAIACQEAVEFSLQIPANALLFCTLAAIAMTPVAARATRDQPMARDNIHDPKELSGVPLP